MKNKLTKFFFGTPQFFEIIKNGICFEFEDGDNTIKLVASGSSGRENVYVNDVEVSQTRNIKFTSRHIFENNGNKYDLTINVTHLFRGGLEVTLLKDNMLIGRQEKIILKSLSWRNVLLTLAACVAVGLVVGVSIALIEKLFF